MDALATYALRFGDNALVLGQRLSAWTGHAPILEEDLAFANVALDLIGQARLWLAYAGRCEGLGRDEDALAYFRSADSFTSVRLVEQPNGDFAQTMARSFFFDRFHLLALRELARSRDETIAGIASKALKEVTYHAERSAEWIVRLGDGTDLSQARMQAALDTLWPFVGELFLDDESDRELVARDIGFLPSTLRDRWLAAIERTIADAGLTLPRAPFVEARGAHCEHAAHRELLLAEMQSVRRGVPGDVW